jgi:hypothetical protein
MHNIEANGCKIYTHQSTQNQSDGRTRGKKHQGDIQCGQCQSQNDFR